MCQFGWSLINIHLADFNIHQRTRVLTHRHFIKWPYFSTRQLLVPSTPKCKCSARTLLAATRPEPKMWFNMVQPHSTPFLPHIRSSRSYKIHQNSLCSVFFLKSTPASAPKCNKDCKTAKIARGKLESNIKQKKHKKLHPSICPPRSWRRSLHRLREQLAGETTPPAVLQPTRGSNIQSYIQSTSTAKSAKNQIASESAS